MNVFIDGWRAADFVYIHIMLHNLPFHHFQSPSRHEERRPAADLAWLRDDDGRFRDSAPSMRECRNQRNPELYRYYLDGRSYLASKTAVYELTSKLFRSISVAIQTMAG